MSPYQEALDFINRYPGTGSAAGMAKLILSIYNSAHSFSLGECLHSFDRDRLDIAIRMIQHYAEHGEDADLCRIGYEIYQTSPRLVELSNAASDAKAKVRNRWRAEEEARLAELYPDG